MDLYAAWDQEYPQLPDVDRRTWQSMNCVHVVPFTAGLRYALEIRRSLVLTATAPRRRLRFRRSRSWLSPGGREEREFSSVWRGGRCAWTSYCNGGRGTASRRCESESVVAVRRTWWNVCRITSSCRWTASPRYANEGVPSDETICCTPVSEWSMWLWPRGF